MRQNQNKNENMTMKLNATSGVLAVTKSDNFNIDITELTDIYEGVLVDELYERISEDLDLGSEIADYIEDNNELRDTILKLVKMEMFARIPKDGEED
jgi:hypothetical protein